MNKTNYILFSFLLLLTTYTTTYAETCDREDIKRLKTLTNNVNVSYAIDNDAINNGDYDTFNVEISNLTDEMYFYFSTNISNYYKYSDTNNGTIIFKYPSGEYDITIASKNCGTTLKKIKIDIPSFNVLSLDDRCKQEKYANLDVCNEWYQFEDSVIDPEEEVNVDSYFMTEDNLDIDNIMDFAKKYYYIFVILIIAIIFLLIITIRRHRKRWSLE